MFMAIAKPLRILIVEDHQDYQQLLVKALTAAGHAVRAADSKQSALELAGTAEFDIVLCDHRLTDGSGSELMRELRSRHGLRGICLSGYEEDELAGTSRDAGFEQFLVKGVPFETIYGAINQVAALPGRKA